MLCWLRAFAVYLLLATAGAALAAEVKPFAREDMASDAVRLTETLRADAIAALLERVGLPGYQQRDVSNLSGGEAQRVSVARTLANTPEALLLDEPTSALDEVSARGVEDLVLSIVRERRIACVIITHNTAQAERIADRTMILQAGRLVGIGPTADVLHAC